VKNEVKGVNYIRADVLENIPPFVVKGWGFCPRPI